MDPRTCTGVYRDEREASQGADKAVELRSTYSRRRLIRQWVGWLTHFASAFRTKNWTSCNGTRSGAVPFVSSPLTVPSSAECALSDCLERRVQSGERQEKAMNAWGANARPGLCGGRRETGVPTAIVSHEAGASLLQGGHSETCRCGGAMKTMAAILLLSCCAFGEDKAAVSATEAGCGPQDARFDVKSDESQHPAPTPEDGKAVNLFRRRPKHSHQRSRN